MKRAKASIADREDALVLGDLIEERRFPRLSANAPERRLADRIFGVAIAQWLVTCPQVAKKFKVTGANWTTRYGFAFYSEPVVAEMRRGAGLQPLTDAFARAVALGSHVMCLFCEESIVKIERRIADANIHPPASHRDDRRSAWKQPRLGQNDAILRDVLAHTQPCGIQWLARMHLSTMRGSR